jgi:hypothetical protein
MDGESILRTLHKDGNQPATPWRSSFLLERGKMTFQRYAKVRIAAYSVTRIVRVG